MNSEPISNKERRKLHAMLRDISRQVQFDGEWWSVDEWKLFVFAAAFGQKVAKNPFGGGPVVINNKRTRSSSVSNAAELITQLYAFGAERGVEWTDPEWKAMREQEKRDAERMVA